ncbi:LytTR family DNA-binding domain-containing protein [Spirosoma utsteinense]|uniref:LytTR family DNA-binding domain-containing protein n=1 Tax=Spirosoma utsteinense TaxID=2585773 RepID=UPI0016453221
MPNKRLFPDDIQFIETYSVYRKIHTKHDIFVVNEKISKIEQKLPHNQFKRIHKPYVINIACFARLESQASYLDKARLGIGVTFKDHVQFIIK